MFERVVYLYRWKLTGSPFYVGSTSNLAARDKAHFAPCSPAGTVKADKFFVQFGRDCFSLEVLEIVKAATNNHATRLARVKENEYIISLNTLKINGGGNYELNMVHINRKKWKQIGISLPFEEVIEFEKLCEKLGQSKTETLQQM